MPSEQETGWVTLDRAKERAAKVRRTLRKQFTSTSVAPPEDNVAPADAPLDPTELAAWQQLQARKRILALRQENRRRAQDEAGTSSSSSSVRRGQGQVSAKLKEMQDNFGSGSNDGEASMSTSKSISPNLQAVLDRKEQADGIADEEEEEEESAMSTAFLVSYFIAGGAAGAASRTVVSPLERLKIIMQVQPKAAGTGKASGRGAYSGVVSGLVKMWQEEGFKGYMRGNGINCLRIAPYSAVQFSTYEVLKAYLTHEDEELDTQRRLLAGALAGIASVVSTYPLDLVRSRISIASASMYAEAKDATSKAQSGSGGKAESKPKLTRQELRDLVEERQKRVPGIYGMTAKVYREEGGVRALYKGCVPTSLGVAPYVGINFAAYESLRKRLADEDGEISTVRKLCCGALAGSISQTLTYPLDVLRRRMQVSGMKDSRLGYSDKSAWGAIRTIVRAEGFFGLYRGIVPNLLKVAPSIGTSFATYEFVRNLIHPPHPPHHHNGNGNGNSNGTSSSH